MPLPIDFGLKRTCHSCTNAFYDLGEKRMPCPVCGAHPPRPASFAVPSGLLDELIDDGLDILGEDSLEAIPSAPPVAFARP